MLLTTLSYAAAKPRNWRPLYPRPVHMETFPLSGMSYPHLSIYNGDICTWRASESPPATIPTAGKTSLARHDIVLCPHRRHVSQHPSESPANKRRSTPETKDKSVNMWPARLWINAAGSHVREKKKEQRASAWFSAVRVPFPSSIDSASSFPSLTVLVHCHLPVPSSK